MQTGESHAAPHRMSRRGLMLGGAAGLAALRAGAGLAQGDSAAPGALTEAVVAGFEADVTAAMATYGMVGVAVALFAGTDVVFARGFGRRDPTGDAPVTPDTLFRVGSNTKSMTSMLIAGLVDDGTFGWDDAVVDIWPDFRAPTPELTRSLRVRDLLGMGSGLAEPETIEFFASAGTMTAQDFLRSIAWLPVTGAPGTVYNYNNTLVCAAAYLGPIALGTAPGELRPAYARLLRDRVFDPVGMTGATLLDDPRRASADVATGCVRDLFGKLSRLPFVSIGGAAPAGAAAVSATGMARYLVAQMNGGVATGGGRVVSAAALEETHRPGITVPPGAPNGLPDLLLPDTTAMHYCMGWFEQTFRDGRRMLWHAGGIDGFASLMGFFPAERLGFVILNNLDPNQSSLFNFALEGALLSRLFGLNRGVPGAIEQRLPAMEQQQKALVDRTRPVDAGAASGLVGLYEGGFRLRLDPAGALRLDHDIRSMPVLATAEGGYMIVDGPGAVWGRGVAFASDEGGLPVMTIDGFDPVRWLTAG